MELVHVSRDPEIMSGELCFTGTRVPVQNLFDYLEGSSSLDVSGVKYFFCLATTISPVCCCTPELTYPACTEYRFQVWISGV